MEKFYNDSKLGQWLLERNESGFEFSRRAFISAPTIYKAIKGLPIRCTTVERILKYTDGLKKEDFKIVNYAFLTVDGNSNVGY